MAVLIGYRQLRKSNENDINPLIYEGIELIADLPKSNLDEVLFRFEI